MAYTIERVKLGDEQTLAYIQTESWKAGFKDILSAAVLEKYTQTDRATAMYRHLLQEKIGNGYLLKVDGAPHCIAWWSDSRDEDMHGYAELICIHSLPQRWRGGYGRKMMETVLADMVKAGYGKAVLWVFEKNERARRFYEALGFVTNGKSKNDFGATEVCYEILLK